MRVLGIVPARAGSHRVPGKNLRHLGGRPLVEWALEAILGSRRVTTVVLSSDDPGILSLVGTSGRVVPLLRPPELATDEAPAIGYVQHALRVLEDGRRPPFEAVAIVQPSSPLTLAEDVDGTVALLESSGADSAVTVVRLDHAVHPVKLKRLEGDRLVPFLEEERGRMASHELPALFVRNCSVYATRRRVVDGGQILGPDCRGYVMPAERSVDINTEMDLLFAEFLLDRLRPQATS